MLKVNFHTLRRGKFFLTLFTIKILNGCSIWPVKVSGRVPEALAFVQDLKSGRGEGGRQNKALYLGNRKTVVWVS